MFYCPREIPSFFSCLEAAQTFNAYQPCFDHSLNTAVRNIYDAGMIFRTFDDRARKKIDRNSTQMIKREL